MPLRLRMGIAGGGRIGVLLNAGRDGRRALDVTQDARVAPRLGLVVEMRRRREGQQGERDNGAPLQQRRPASSHACLLACLLKPVKGETARFAAPSCEGVSAGRPPGRDVVRRAALRTDGDRGTPTDPLVEPHRVAHPDPAAHLGGPSLDEGGVVPIQRVQQAPVIDRCIAFGFRSRAQRFVFTVSVGAWRACRGSAAGYRGSPPSEPALGVPSNGETRRTRRARTSPLTQ